MVDRFKILAKETKRFRYLSLMLFSITVVILVIANVTKQFLLFLPAILCFLFLLWLFRNYKKLLDQSIEIFDDHIIYRMTAGEVAEFRYDEIRFAGFYKKNLNDEQFDFHDGLYVYLEKIDRYYIIGADFERRSVLYASIKERCIAHRVTWHDIQRVNKDSLVLELRKLLKE